MCDGTAFSHAEYMARRSLSRACHGPLGRLIVIGKTAGWDSDRAAAAIPSV